MFGPPRRVIIECDGALCLRDARVIGWDQVAHVEAPTKAEALAQTLALGWMIVDNVRRHLCLDCAPAEEA